MKVFAHRGFSALYPENTLLAFQKALEAGADGIETDLRLTRDGHIVLFHDDDLLYLAGIKGKVESFTLERLQELKIGEGESIPTLESLLSLVHGDAILILEIKYVPETYKKVCESVAQMIADKLDWVEVSCFEDNVLEYIHRLNPSVRLHKIIDTSSVLATMSENSHNDYLYYLDINMALREEALKRGLLDKYEVILWTVAKEDLTKEIEAGLYGVMMDDMREAYRYRGPL
ncbi:glycerophosphodiester phosphodiesterase [Sulfurovum lithotrophicum]|uniref:glycerophosphodiester phosphodiesterase n=1 Tax=Sulfurovum lithotrophicum TaxID=206403 RepID=UPI0006990842|nr:glycerophosphodiester phosphodiesterase [Sulfurovum lithotrophicum]